MPVIISVTEAARNFSDIVNRVNYQGQTFLLTRGGVIVARLTSSEKATVASDFIRLWAERPRLDPLDAETWEQELQELKAAGQLPKDDVWDS
jgi:antitoxin (DNA-binding transcriptional repressor) of toxin-antitoxin stability system